MHQRIVFGEDVHPVDSDFNFSIVGLEDEEAPYRVHIRIYIQDGAKTVRVIDWKAPNWDCFRVGVGTLT